MLTRLAALVVGLACVSGGAVAATTDATRPGKATTTFDDLPVGVPTTLPWWQRGRLHLGDTVIRTRRSDLASRNGTTVVAVGEDRRMGEPTKWFLVDGKRLERLPMRTRVDQPLISADGRWLAWQEVRARRTAAYRRIERYRVVIYNVQRQRIASRFRDRRLVAWEDGINGIWLRTLSNDGRLVFHQGSGGVKVMSPRARPVRFRGPQVGNDVDLDGWPSGTTVFRSRSDTSVYGVVGRDGSFDRTGRFADPFSGLWSANGSAYAYTNDGTEDTTYWIRPLDGEALQLDAPSDVSEFRIVGWESADSVILWYSNDYSSTPKSRLVRCSATSGACERVPGGPKARAWASMPSRY